MTQEQYDAAKRVKAEIHHLHIFHDNMMDMDWFECLHDRAKKAILSIIFDLEKELNAEFEAL